METQLAEVEAAFTGLAGYAGTSIHDATGYAALAPRRRSRLAGGEWRDGPQSVRGPHRAGLLSPRCRSSSGG